MELKPWRIGTIREERVIVIKNFISANKHGHSANLNPRLMLTDLHPFITYVRQLLFECVRMHAKARCALGSRRVSFDLKF